MATRPKSSRRNRKFGQNLVLQDGGNIIENILTSTYTEPTLASDSGGSTVSSTGVTDSLIGSSSELSFNSPNNQPISDELCELKRWGILPEDFPSCDGDIAEQVGTVDITNEFNELLQIGAVSSSDSSELKESKKQSEPLGNELPIFSINNDEIPDFDNSGLPLNWSDYDATSDIYKLIELERGDKEFDAIEQEFRNVHIHVKKIERLQNKRILDRFKSEADDLNRHRSGDFCINIKYLFHGTNVNKEALCEEGLDQRLSRMGYFGRGIYFSDNPLKCVHYSEDIKQAGPYEAYILKCRVILGDIKVYPKGASHIDLKREPEKEVPSHGSKYYDSVLGCPKDFNEYVVYENRRAMIEYIITFQADDDVIKNLRQLSKTGLKEIDKKIEEMPETESFPTVCKDGNIDLPSPESCDDHFSRISDVREAVRKKRLGATYVPPSREQKKKDKEMWKKIQRLQGVQPETKGEILESKTNSTFQCGKEKPPPVIIRDNDKPPPVIMWGKEQQEETTFSQNLEGSYGDMWQRNSGSTSLLFQDTTEDLSDSLNDDHMLWSSAWNNPTVTSSDMSVNGSVYRNDNPVEQVLSVCVAEFLSITGLEDAGLAKHYVMKSEMDLNRAISLYYEDIL